MQNSEKLSHISNDHFHALLFAELIKKREGFKTPDCFYSKIIATIEFYFKELTEHFIFEEMKIFDRFYGKDKNLDLLFDRLKNEHKLIIELINSLKENEDIEEKLDLLGNLIENHIRKEERELLPKIKLLFSENELLKINAQN